MSNLVEADVIMTGYAALQETASIVTKYGLRLREGLPESILLRSGLNSETDNYSYQDIIKNLDKHLYKKVYSIGYGGVYKALWEMAEDMGSGLRVYLKDIPIRQETIEICNFLDINPYMLDGTGSFLVVSEYGSKIVRHLTADAGINATIIGHTTQDNDRIVINNDEVKYLSFRINDESDKLNK